MKIDKDKLNALLAMPDAELWSEIRKIAGTHGFTLPERTPPGDDMQRLRDAVSGGGLNLGRAVKIINDYRKRDAK